MVLTCAAALAIFAGPLSRDLLGGSALLDLQVLAAILPFTVAYDICLAATRGFGTVKAATLLEKLIRPGLQLALLLAVAATGKANLLALAWALPYLVVLPPAVVVLRRLIRKENVKQEHRPGGDIAKTFWKFAAPRSISGLAQALLQRLDIVIVAAILGARRRGGVRGRHPLPRAGTARQPGHLGAGGAAAVRTARAPRHRRSAGRLPHVDGLADLRELADVPGDGGVRVDHHGGLRQGLSQWLVSGDAAVPVHDRRGRGRPGRRRARLRWPGHVEPVQHVAALTINITVDVLLLPHIGVIGAAVGWGVAILATNIVPLLQIHRLLGLHPFGKRVFTAAGITSVSFALIPGVIRLLLGSGVVRSSLPRSSAWPFTSCCSAGSARCSSSTCCSAV